MREQQWIGSCLSCSEEATTMNDTSRQRTMVNRQLVSRGITDARVLAALETVPRESFLPKELAEYAYDDTPLPIGAQQTISQPYIVALMAEVLVLKGNENVLEVGTGSGYAAAVLSQVAKEVYTVERINALATQAKERLERLGYQNVRVLCGDGTLGWPERAPYDAIVVAAGGPEVPKALLSQLVVGGRLVMPVGADESSQQLVRVTHVSKGEYKQEYITEVRFVPLIGEQGFPPEQSIARAPIHAHSTAALSALIRETAEPIADLESATVDAILERVGDSRVVLLGESTHGTSEFYRMRARLTRGLVERKGFDFVAIEADWPDAQRVHTYVTGQTSRSSVEFIPFERFPRWMWRNQEAQTFMQWLCAHNANTERAVPVGFHGLDLYSMFTSIAMVLGYLDDVDPVAATVARSRYGTLTPWQKDPAAYGRAVFGGRCESSEAAVVAMLADLLAQRLAYAVKDGARFFDAAQNARVVANAEHYYRAMYYGSAASWNLRDAHMFETLQSLLAFYGPKSRGVIWAHNSHIGNAAATEMSACGEHNLGQLCRAAFGLGAYLIGFGTDHGTVAAASNWDEPMQRMPIRAAHDQSYEKLFHDSRTSALTLHLREPRRAVIRDELLAPRLERAIGVIYRPDTELQSHYFAACLPQQFDEYIWFDETCAITPLEASVSVGSSNARPSGL